ncbi:MAG TPA: radical SAM protein [Candidatus Sumerlaeota bacterium]|nr:MAG: molybdenum cofactor biosynthesis protein A [candidate division BRC1 bacterium ADurb.BinA292]HOE95178.1 radical SAM protein [Candidatus Sumerlaeota bacterium]HOR28043.1 radical SAM protein [Candidatus Sumerlaeota bacterium]HPK01121.1 radical SAM protein [Candidatus Sumerlaeota bacterium]
MPPKYYMPEPTRPIQWFRHKYIEKLEPVPEVPKNVQIQTISGCNASCVFCPNKKTDLQIPFANRMDWDLYRSIIDQISEMGVRRISPYLMNEPMLDPEFPKRVEYITRKKKPWQFSKINSHGGLLTERMAKGILDAGLDRVNFSVQGLDPVIYEDVMKLPLQKTLDNIDRLLELKRAGNYKKPRIRVCMLMTKYIEPQMDKIQEYWGSRGVKININQLENRGKHKAIKSDEIAVRQLQNYDWCSRMFEQMYILYDGRMVMCCADWEQTGVMGDASKKPLREIWHDEVYTRYRRNFLRGRVQGTICDGCTKDGAGDEYDD